MGSKNACLMYSCTLREQRAFLTDSVHIIEYAHQTSVLSAQCAHWKAYSPSHTVGSTQYFVLFLFICLVEFE